MGGGEGVEEWGVKGWEGGVRSGGGGGEGVEEWGGGEGVEEWGVKG